MVSDAPVVADKTSEENEEILHAIAASMESIKDTSGSGSQVEDVNLTNPDEITCQDKKPSYPPLTEEPKGDKTLLCRVGVRLPDGRRVQRNFFHTDPIQVKIDDRIVIRRFISCDQLRVLCINCLCLISLNVSMLTSLILPVNILLTSFFMSFSVHYNELHFEQSEKMRGVSKQYPIP